MGAVPVWRDARELDVEIGRGLAAYPGARAEAVCVTAPEPVMGSMPGL